MRVIAQLIDYLPQVSEAGEVIDAIMSLPFMNGITGIMIARMPLLGEKPSDNMILSSWSTKWISHYMEKSYLMFDPIARHLLSTRRPFVWSEYCTSINLSDIQINVMREAREFGLIDGFTIPVHDFNSTMCISFSTSGEYLPLVRRELLRTIGLIALERIDDIGHFQRYNGPCARSVLAPREIDYLYYAQMGGG